MYKLDHMYRKYFVGTILYTWGRIVSSYRLRDSLLFISVRFYTLQNSPIFSKKKFTSTEVKIKKYSVTIGQELSPSSSKKKRI